MKTPLLQDATELELQHPALCAHATWQSGKPSKLQTAKQQNSGASSRICSDKYRAVCIQILSDVNGRDCSEDVQKREFIRQSGSTASYQEF
jgi:hypothetical protein